MNSRPLVRASLWMLGASVAFALMAAAVKLAANRGVPLSHTLFYRGLISVALTGLYMRVAGVAFGTPNWRAHLQRGVAGFVGMIAYFGGIMLLPLAAAVTLNYTSPLILSSLLMAKYRERPSPALVAAMLGGFLGILLLLKPSYQSSQWLGVTLAIASAVTAAIAALNIRSLGRLDEPVSRTVAWFSLIVTVGSLPWYLATDPLRIDPLGAAYVGAVGVLATVGQVMLTLAYQRGHTHLVSLLGYSQVIFTTLVGIALWDDHPGPGAWLAMGLIVLCGIAATAVSRATQERRAQGA